MTVSNSNNVVLVEDDDLVASSISSVMRSRGYVVSHFYSGEELIAQCKTEPDGCMVVDIDLGPLKMTGLELLKWLRSQNWTNPVIILSGKVTVPEAVEALKETVVDIISKPPSVPRLMSAIELSLAGANSVTKQQAAKLRGKLQSLSALERSVLKMLLSGSSNKVIAARLDLGLRSAVRYRKAILDTFGFDTVPELASALGAAGISLTELTIPPVLAPGIPQRHRSEIRSQIQHLQNTLAKVDLESLHALRAAVLDAQAELERIANLPLLATPNASGSTPSVVILSADPQVGGLLRDLLRSHGLFTESCQSIGEVDTGHGSGVAAPPSYLIAFESATIDANQLRELAHSRHESTQMLVIQSASSSVQPEQFKNVQSFGPVSGQHLVNHILNDLAANG